MVRRVAMIVALLVLCSIGFVAFTAPAPYAIPARRFVEPAHDITPTTATRDDLPRRVVLLVFDGLSPAAVRAAQTPALDRMAREGASSLDMRPEFPTLSLPNHFTLGTGCRPGRHGIVSNHFEDPERGIYNAKGDADWLLDCQLLHEVAEAQGVRSAVFGAVGNSSSSRGRLATLAEPFRLPPRSAEEQIDRVIEVLEERPDIGLVVAYATEPDRAGHAFGPTAPETLAATEEVDAQIARVIDAIEARAHATPITLVVTTDHGMVDAEPVMLNFDGIVRDAGVPARVVGVGAVAHVHLDDPETRAAAKLALSGGAHYDVLDPSEPATGLDLGRSSRVGDLVLAAHPGHWGADLANIPWYLRWASWLGGETVEAQRFRGIHGYDPDRAPGVRAVLFAWGDRVAAGTRVEGLRSIDVHPSVAAMLEIAPSTALDGRAHPSLAVSPVRASR